MEMLKMRCSNRVLTKRLSLLILLGVCLLTVLGPGVAQANTGMENISYGARSAGMGGTAVAVGDDSTAMNINPAAISNIDGGRVDANLEMMFPFFSFENRDSTGTARLNKTHGNTPVYLIPGAGFVYHEKGSRWSFGFGMFNEGGTGTDYGILTVDNRFLEMLPAGTPSFSNMEYFSNLGYMKLTPTVSYNVTDKLAIALSPQVGYSTMKMKMPFFMDQNGNGAPDSLFAADMDGTAFSLGAKVGILYKFSEKFGLGIAYSTPVDINIEGDASMVAPVAQMGGMIPAQSVMKGDLEMDIGWPQSVKAGMFWKMSFLNRMVLAFDVEWFDWSHYFDSIPLRLKNVTMDGVPQPDRAFKMDLNWKDQWVFKLGLEYPATDKLRLRTGYVYGKNPVSSSQGVLAIMNPFVEHHITGGMGYQISDHFEFNMALIYGLNKNEEVGASHNMSPDMMNSTTGMEFLSMTTMLSYRW
jgi:long-chain fatty acid transport protein